MPGIGKFHIFINFMLLWNGNALLQNGHHFKYKNLQLLVLAVNYYPFFPYSL